MNSKCRSTPTIVLAPPKEPISPKEPAPPEAVIDTNPLLGFIEHFGVKTNCIATEVEAQKLQNIVMSQQGKLLSEQHHPKLSQ